MIHIRYFFIFISFTSLLVQCTSDYQKYVETEIAKNIRNDSLIFDMYIGQTQKEFYEQCWELNRQQLISQGTGNRSAKYIEPFDSLNPNPKRKEMLFYGLFDENKIMYGMEMTYSYTAWSPWSDQHQAIHLLEEIKSNMLEDYKGNPFLEIELDENYPSAWVKVDGNRQILVYQKSKKDVYVKIEDLTDKFKDL